MSIIGVLCWRQPFRWFIWHLTSLLHPEAVAGVADITPIYNLYLPVSVRAVYSMSLSKGMAGQAADDPSAGSTTAANTCACELPRQAEVSTYMLTSDGWCATVLLQVLHDWLMSYDVGVNMMGTALLSAEWRVSTCVGPNLSQVCGSGAPRGAEQLWVACEESPLSV